jgi:hypothetical protein
MMTSMNVTSGASVLSFVLIPALLVMGSTASAQVQPVQVSREPRHHNVFQNAWVRILDVRVPPGDTTFFHKHSTPSVFLVLSHTKTGSEVLVEPPKTRLTSGNIWFEGFYDKPRIHRVWNSDTIEFHTIDMELLATRHQAIDPPLDSASYHLLFDEIPVRGYRFTLAGGASLHLSGRKAPMELMVVSDPAGTLLVNDKPLTKKGDNIFIPPGGNLVLVNRGVSEQSFALFELK